MPTTGYPNSWDDDSFPRIGGGGAGGLTKAEVEALITTGLTPYAKTTKTDQDCQNCKDNIKKKIDTPQNRGIGAVPIASGIGSSVEWRLLEDYNVSVDTSAFPVPPHAIGLNSNDTTMQRIVKKLSEYEAPTLMNSPETMEYIISKYQGNGQTMTTAWITVMLGVDLTSATKIVINSKGYDIPRGQTYRRADSVTFPLRDGQMSLLSTMYSTWNLEAQILDKTTGQIRLRIGNRTRKLDSIVVYSEKVFGSPLSAYMFEVYDTPVSIGNTLTILNTWSAFKKRIGDVVNLSYRVPMRNKSSSWGGGYLIMEYSIDNGSTWKSFYDSGHEGAMSQYREVINSISGSMIVDIQEVTDAKEVIFRYQVSAFQGTLDINKDHGITQRTGNVDVDELKAGYTTIGLSIVNRIGSSVGSASSSGSSLKFNIITSSATATVGNINVIDMTNCDNPTALALPTTSIEGEEIIVITKGIWHGQFVKIINGAESISYLINGDRFRFVSDGSVFHIVYEDFKPVDRIDVYRDGTCIQYAPLNGTPTMKFRYSNPNFITHNKYETEGFGQARQAVVNEGAFYMEQNGTPPELENDFELSIWFKVGNPKPMNMLIGCLGVSAPNGKSMQIGWIDSTTFVVDTHGATAIWTIDQNNYKSNFHHLFIAYTRVSATVAKTECFIDGTGKGEKNMFNLYSSGVGTLFCGKNNTDVFEGSLSQFRAFHNSDYSKRAERCKMAFYTDARLSLGQSR